MKVIYDSEKLSKLIKTKRIIDLDIDMREAAKKIGISLATLSRLENGKEPDINTLAKACHWIKQPIDSFFIKK